MPHLEGTVVGAIPRADAAVVRHVVQAFGAVRGRGHRADVFARRVLALHARQRLLHHARIVFRDRRNSDPCGSSASRVRASPVLADHRDVVFRLRRRPRRRCSRCRHSGRSPCPTDCPCRTPSCRINRLERDSPSPRCDFGVLLVLLERRFAHDAAGLPSSGDPACVQSRACRRSLKPARSSRSKERPRCGTHWHWSRRPCPRDPHARGHNRERS